MRLCAVGLLLAAGLLCLAAGNGTPEDAAAKDRTITDPAITESSGLARSLLHPGVLWTHNDSGNPPKLFAIGTDGRTVATITVNTEYDWDWEAIATLRGPDGRAMVAVSDTGDNTTSRKWAEILLLPEPADLRSQTITPTRVLRFHYPDGPHDVETLLADPHGDRLYLVSKTLFGAQLYAVPARQWPGRATGFSEFTTERVARLGADLVTDGTVLPDGRLLLRGYGDLTLLGRPADVQDGVLPALAVRILPFQDQGESLTLTADGRQALIGSEGKDEAVLRVPIPTPGRDPTTEFGDDTPRPSLSSSAPTTTAAHAVPVSLGPLAPLVIAGGVLLAALALLAGWFAFRR